MTEKLQQTQAMLKKHHRDGPAFAKAMEDSFENRFNADFWALWEKRVAPGLRPGSIVVDLGTGPASFPKALAEKFPDIRIAGVEAADYMIDAVGEIPDSVEIIVADLQDPHLSFDDQSVDVAVASVVVHEMIQPVRMFKEVSRILKPNSYFYIFDWVRVSLQQYLEGQEFNPFEGSVSVEELEDLFEHFIEHNRFSTTDLTFMLNQTGFDVLDSGEKNRGQHAWILSRKV